MHTLSCYALPTHRRTPPPHLTLLVPHTGITPDLSLLAYTSALLRHHPLNQNQPNGVDFAVNLTPSQSVRYAWDATNTASSSVKKILPGTKNTVPLPHALESRSSHASPTLSRSVQNGSARVPAQANIPISTFARDAEITRTALLTALERRKLVPLTPYKADAWMENLRHFGLLHRFTKVTDGLRFGFILNFPLIAHVQSPPNNSSIVIHSDNFKQTIDKEITKGRYIGPFPLYLIGSTLGPYQSSPLSIIPKPGRPDKFRLIQNFSFPLSPSPDFPNPSINSQIQASDFPTTWGKFSVIYLLISRLPPGSEAATRDIAEAYRTIPLHPSQWAAAVVRISDTLGCIDTCMAFGATPSAGAYGHMADAGCEIMRHTGLGPLDKWVDDHLFFRIRRAHLADYNMARQHWHEVIKCQGPITTGSRIWFEGSPMGTSSHEEFGEDCSTPIVDLSNQSSCSEHDALCSYCMDDIDSVSNPLGIPWEPSKDQPFASTVDYLGFTWDLNKRQVFLSIKKVTKYIQAINDWLGRKAHTLVEVQGLYGKLIHASAALLMGRAFLTGLERMMRICSDKPFLPHRPEKTIKDDLRWWKNALQSGLVSKTIFPPSTPVDIQAFSDASSLIGIGIVVGSHWKAWRLIPGWQTLNEQRDISWAEAIGFELLIYAIATIPGITGSIIVHGDNTGIVEGWRNGRHCNRAANEVFKRIHQFLRTLPHRLEVVTQYIPSAFNPADPPSRGILGPPHLTLPEIQLPEPLRPFLISSLAPLSEAERAAACKRVAAPTPSAAPKTHIGHRTATTRPPSPPFSIFEDSDTKLFLPHSSTPIPL